MVNVPYCGGVCGAEHSFRLCRRGRSGRAFGGGRGRGHIKDARLRCSVELVEFVSGADADGVFAGGYGGRNDVPKIDGNAVDGEVVEVGGLIAAVGAVGVEEAGDEVARFQVTCLEEGGFDLDADEASSEIDDYVVLGGVAQGLG